MRPGVSLIRMDAELDTGPIVAQRRVPLMRRDSAISLESRLAVTAADLLDDSLEPWLDGEIAACSRSQRTDAIDDAAAAP